MLQVILYDKYFTKFIQASLYLKFNIKLLHQFGIQFAHQIYKKIIFAIIFYYEQGIFFQINLILNNISKKKFIPNLIHIKPIPKCKYTTIFIYQKNTLQQKNTKQKIDQISQTTTTKKKKNPKNNISKTDFSKDYLSKKVRIPLRTSNINKNKKPKFI